MPRRRHPLGGPQQHGKEMANTGASSRLIRRYWRFLTFRLRSR